MCGICGYVGVNASGLLEKMTEALVHRGPDSAGYYRDRDVGLGHRRLSIIDVAGGQQPIENETGSIVLICNGEIYNYRELRAQLLSRGHRFRTKSDSEVILHLYEDDGAECLRRLNGMFAFAIYDKDRRRLFLARDRLGIKPLYYAALGKSFLFASEFKSILRYADLHPTLNRRAVHEYLALRYVPGPNTLFDEIQKLAPGHYAVVQNGEVKLTRYWQPTQCTGPYPGNEQDYIEGFAEQFERSIQRRLISEVPLGAYLSGGLDSSTIVAAIANRTSKPVHTFAVGFDYEHDELKEAAATAKILGCNHTEIACRATDIELLPQVIYHLDQPIGDPIIIPTAMLAREAKKNVTVVLTGEGADEALGGYLFHKALLTGHRIARLIPLLLRRAMLIPAVAATPASLINQAFDYPAALGKRGKLKVLDFLKLLDPQSLPSAYRHLISLFDERDTQELFADSFAEWISSDAKPTADTGPAARDDISAISDVPYLNRILHLQFEHWLPDLILMRQDKLSMASAVEARVPFLDHELLEYALRIPPTLKIRKGASKYILRRYAERILPKEVAFRRKMPFYFPIENYFTSPQFRDLMHDTLSERAVRARGLLRPEAVAKLCQRMEQGEFMFVKQVFSLITLELWFRAVVDRRSAS